MNTPQSCPALDSPVVEAALAPSWGGLVDRVHKGDPNGLEELYRIFDKGIRFQLIRRMGSQDLDDRVHDVFLIITEAIQRGELRDPERLMGYVRTVVQRQIAAHFQGLTDRRHKYIGVDGVVLRNREPSPERAVIERQNGELAERLLDSLSARDRDVLIRFYLREQPKEDICREMGLTATQFRLIKCRAKARFGVLGKARMARRNIQTY